MLESLQQLWAWMVAYEQAVKDIIRIGTLLLIGIPVCFWVGRIVRRRVTRHFNTQYGLLAGKAVTYLGIILIAFATLQELGFPLTHLTGAAGILGLAIGFASQTSVSNVISGLFLVTEKPFLVGDVISVNGNSGEILSIDTLSVKLRTFDNRMVRIPNETLIKSDVTNITAFPIRRVDLNIGVAYKERLDEVRMILMDVAERNPLVLQEPAPQFMLTGYGSSSVDMMFAVWAVSGDYVKVRNQMRQQIKQAFEEDSIEIPFPHFSICKGAETDPIPVQVVDRPFY